LTAFLLTAFKIKQQIFESFFLIYFQGKTHFAYYVLKYLMRIKQPFVYETCANDHLYCYSGDDENPFVVTTMKQFDYIKGDFMYIVDGKVPRSSAHRTLLICSCDPSHYKLFQKHMIRTYYMPCWSLDELEDCVDQIISQNADTNDKSWVKSWKYNCRSLFTKYGGVPRFVMENARLMISVDQELDRKLDKISVKDLVENLESKEVESRALSHLVIHMIVDNEFGLIGKKFASDYVTISLIRNNSKTSALYSKEEKLLVPYVGDLFEASVHSYLSKSSNKMNDVTPLCLIATRLQNSDNVELKIQRKERHNLTEDMKDDAHLALLNNNSYYQVKKNFPSIDSFVIANDKNEESFLFQMTLGESHSIIASETVWKLIEHIRATGRDFQGDKTKKIKFVFISANNKLLNKKEQKVTISNAKINDANYESIRNNIAHNIEQYLIVLTENDFSHIQDRLKNDLPNTSQ
jgi:hypothetical protein